jgi:hypothetical protein
MIAVEESFTNSAIASLPEPQLAVETPLYEAALLIDLVGGASTVPAPETDWDVLLNMAAENGVLAHVFHALQIANTKIPDSFARAARESKAAAIHLAVELENLLVLFAQHKIDALPLKGPALSLELYGDAAMRSSYDLDILVRREDFSRAEALLIDQKFLPDGPPGGYHRQLLRDALIVELHSDLSDDQYIPVDTEGIWSRVRAASFCSTPVYAMSRQDLALYLCCHGAKHRFSRLIWTLDVAQSLQGWHDSEYESLLKQAQQSSIAPWLFLACAVLRAVFPHLLPNTMDAHTSSLPINKRAERAAARMFSGISKMGVEDYRCLYLQIEPSFRKRLRYGLGYLALSPHDRRLAYSHRVPAVLMLALRPFRLLGKYGIRRAFRIFFPQS